MELRREVVSPQTDFLLIMEEVLGPRFDEKGEQRWVCVVSDNEIGFIVSDGTHEYFYEGPAGVKRIWYMRNGAVDQVSTRPFRTMEEDFPTNRTVVNWG